MFTGFNASFSVRYSTAAVRIITEYEMFLLLVVMYGKGLQQ